MAKMTRVNTVNNIAEEDKVTETKRTFEKTDMIPCRSICNGQLFVDGGRTGMLYQWADYDDVIEVEHQDLVYMINRRDINILEPRFIVLDDDFVNNYQILQDLYNSIYTHSDLVQILNLAPTDMKRAIESLPSGAKSSIKGLASTMIDNGTLDSIKKVKVIDDIFGTKLLLTLAED